MAGTISNKQLHNINPARAERHRQKEELVFLNTECVICGIRTSALFHAPKAQLIPWKDDGSLFVEHTNGRELFLKLETTPLQPQVLKISSCTSRKECFKWPCNQNGQFLCFNGLLHIFFLVQEAVSLYTEVFSVIWSFRNYSTVICGFATQETFLFTINVKNML